MGYTLVTSFDDRFDQKMNRVLKGLNTNKIPYGRKCDRNIADRALPYHMTLVHWGKESDQIYLPRLDRLRVASFKLRIAGTDFLYAEEGSLLLYFSVMPGDGFADMANNIANTIGMPVSSFLHITIAVSQDHSYIRKIREIIDENFSYPFELTVSELELYHIWNPVRLESRISSEPGKL